MLHIRLPLVLVPKMQFSLWLIVISCPCVTVLWRKKNPQTNYKPKIKSISPINGFWVGFMFWQGTSAFFICFGKQHPRNVPMALVVTGEIWAEPANAQDTTYKQSSNQFPLNTVPRPIVSVSNQEVGREEFSTNAELAINLQYKWEWTGHIKGLNVILILHRCGLESTPSS